MSSSDAALAGRAAGADSRSPNNRRLWQQDESGRVHTPFEPVVLAVTLTLIPILIIEADPSSDDWQTFATVANWIIWGIFMTELVAVLVVAAQKRAALRAHWLDVAIVVLTIPLLGKARWDRTNARRHQLPLPTDRSDRVPLVKDDRRNEHQQLVEMLRRIEADVTELKATHRSHSG